MHGSPKLSLLTHITLLRPYYFVLLGFTSYLHKYIKFIYSEKATEFCEISPLLLTICTVVKSKGKISQNFVAFSEYMNFTTQFGDKDFVN